MLKESCFILRSFNFFLFSLFVFYLTLSNSVLCSGPGRCPNYPKIENFNKSRILGKWYEVERTFYVMEIASACTTVKIKENKSGQLEVLTYGVNRLTGNVAAPSKGVATQIKQEPSIFTFRVQSQSLPSFFESILPGSGTYQILATDYDNYLVLWSCSNLRLYHFDMIWVMGRARDIDAAKRFEIYNKLERLGLNYERLILSKNRNCPIE